MGARPSILRANVSSSVRGEISNHEPRQGVFAPRQGVLALRYLRANGVQSPVRGEVSNHERTKHLPAANHPGHERSEQVGHQHQGPGPALQDVVVGGQPLPGLAHDVVAEAELEGHGEGGPEEPHGEKLRPGGGAPQQPEHEAGGPEDGRAEHQGGDPAGGQLPQRRGEHGLPEDAVGYGYGDEG